MKKILLAVAVMLVSMVTSAANAYAQKPLWIYDTRPLLGSKSVLLVRVPAKEAKTESTAERYAVKIKNLWLHNHSGKKVNGYEVMVADCKGRYAAEVCIPKLGMHDIDNHGYQRLVVGYIFLIN